MAEKIILKRVVLSEKNHQLLIRICRQLGSETEARKNPEFVLEVLLKKLNREKKNVSSGAWGLLEDAIGKTSLEYARDLQGVASDTPRKAA
jgi:hypothetical protein